MLCRLSDTGQQKAESQLRRDSQSPMGLRRHPVVCGVAAPRRWQGIDCVAAPAIRPNGARNATLLTATTDC